MVLAMWLMEGIVVYAALDISCLLLLLNLRQMNGRERE
jgi:hypothetical protein